ncbi:putative diphthamide synthesis protein-domain-containing protein [Suillus clintonianus]|uniref:putative diphthamide synthesis protein-domain-containing protein n=1 Tax=Suillus clintonianus TaxID=1904413 RepID=UPI001B86630B|nr:putative diphthamide synthesis protein-domain-containing protein [Suillus clintonianus]KAG2124801.1 putative diphthamide synthesis protein-domain-containing protein [Suillus clintonianus]
MTDVPAVSTFSASGEDAITRTIELNIDSSTQDIAQSDFLEIYEIERTVTAIVEGDFKRTALQFPDELLRHSVPIYRLLKSKAGEGHDIYVLADTSYGSCCVDEVAAQHVDADLIVHYGHACLSQPSRLPVIYVFGKKPIDVDDCINQLGNCLTTRLQEDTNSDSGNRPDILLRYDVGYSYCADVITHRLGSELQSLTIRVLHDPLPTRLDPKTTVHSPKTFEPAVAKADEDICTNVVIAYIGGESLNLTNLLMTHSHCEVYAYDPSTRSAHLQSHRTNKLLMRRFAMVQRARDADVFGILVGTLGVTSYLPLIAHVRKLLARAQKKSYTISVGKLNPAKLANFMEIECFILIACPENSVIDAKEFLRPIVTPFELEVALQAEGTWSGRYVLDFEKLLAGDSENDIGIVAEGNESDPDQPTFSLITGKYRQARRYGTQDNETSTEGTSAALTLRNQDGAISKLADSAAALFLNSRSYQGLETKIGEDSPSVLEQGRSGIARGYSDDHA